MIKTQHIIIHELHAIIFYGHKINTLYRKNELSFMFIATFLNTNTYRSLKTGNCECMEPIATCAKWNSQLDATASIDLETNLLGVTFKDKGTARTHGVFMLSHSLALLLWTASLNVIQI